MKPIIHEHKSILISLGVVAVICIAAIIYSFVRIDSLSSRIDTLSGDLASTTKSLQVALADTHDSLSNAISTEKQNVGNLQQQLQSQVGNLSGTLNTLQKLAKTDPEILKKYSKVYFLNDNYVPLRLSEIPQKYQYSNTKQLAIHTDVLPRLEMMIEAASSTGVKLFVSSAYRSFAEQRALKGDYRITYGAGTANSFSADQGYSEHQLGTAVDMITFGTGGQLEGFDRTAAYQWMLANAYKYGFVLSYPKDNNYYVFEPWHWRFVGVKLATDLHDMNRGFYSMDQRTIDAYLANVFD